MSVGIQLNIDHPDYSTRESPRRRVPAFGRHETFHPRFGWIKKGFDAALRRPDVFSREDAPVILGVGRNMVKAIRYWCLATKVLKEQFVPKTRIRQMVPTEFGMAMLGDNGWDPFLERLESLWLLHWKLLSEPCLATTWDFAFNEFRRSEFTAEELFYSMKTFINHEFVSHQAVDSTLTRDVSCFLRMYAEPHHKKSLHQEESIDSPFVELGLIRSSNDGNYYYFNVANKPGLRSSLIVWACLEYALSYAYDANTISISRLLYDSYSPGAVFKLPESVLYNAIETVSHRVPTIALSDTAGLVQMSISGDPLQLSQALLNGLFHEVRKT